MSSELHKVNIYIFYRQNSAFRKYIFEINIKILWTLLLFQFSVWELSSMKSEDTLTKFLYQNSRYDPEFEAKFWYSTKCSVRSMKDRCIFRFIRVRKRKKERYTERERVTLALNTIEYSIRVVLNPIKHWMQFVRPDI